MVKASCLSVQLQSFGPAAIQKPGTAQREAPVRHRGDGGIRTGVTQEIDTEPQHLIQWDCFFFAINIQLFCIC